MQAAFSPNGFRSVCRARRMDWGTRMHNRFFRPALGTVFALALLDLAGTAWAADAPLMSAPGHFNVSPAGAATYSIPIAVPPGTAGMVPAISLDYSSQNHDGIVGWGWALSFSAAVRDHSGIAESRASGRQPANQQIGPETTDNSGIQSYTPPSVSGALGGGGDGGMIMRCPRTLAQDGIHGGANYDANDRFCLNGQRLVAISGTYGVSGSEYRTEIESFTRIILHNDAVTATSWFEVRTKGGQRLEYGNTADSRVVSSGIAAPRAWGLDKASDTKGNYLTVTYTQDAANGEIYPHYIDYTGSAIIAPYNRIEFDYTSRVDAPPYYQAGYLQKFTSHLSEIKTFQSGSLVLDYKLAYREGTTTTHSRLTSVTPCDSSGTTCLAATTFAWQGGTGALGFTSVAISLGPYAIPLLADINGDGILDTVASTNIGSCWTEWQVYTGTATGGFSLTLPNYGCELGNAQPIDLNGDGISDFMLSYGIGFPTNKFALNTGTGLTNVSTTLTGSYWAADFDGDGRTDMYSDAADNSTGTAQMLSSNGDGTFTSKPAPNIPWVGIDVADFDGDGCADIIEGSRQTVPPLPTSKILYSCNPAVATVTVFASLGFIGDSSFRGGVIGDFNGDGKADVFINSILNLSTGTGFVATTFNLTSITSLYSTYSIHAGDFNGDGKTDLAVWSNDSGTGVVTIYLSTGTSFVLGGSVTIGAGNAEPADLDGDGASDILATSSGAGIGEFLTSFAPELMTSVSNGIGMTTNIAYDRLNKNAPLYIKGTGATYPMQDIDNAMYVVSRVDASNGTSTFSCSPPSLTNCYTTTYAYAGAKADLLGRGFLGFTTVTARDPQTGIVQTTNYHTDFPYVSAVASQTVVTTITRNGCMAGITLKSVVNAYSAPTPTVPTTPLFVALQQSVVSGNDCDGSPLPETTTAYTYDAYGNATQVAATVRMGGTVSSTSVTNNTFSNDTTNWLFLLTATATTNTVGSSIITRTISFGYDVGTDFLNHQTTEPGSGTLLLDSAYTLDVFGNRTAATITGSAITSRTTSATFDAQGRFALTTTNAKGHVDSYTYDPRFGGVTGHTDPNGAVSSTTYDSFGRPTLAVKPDLTRTAWVYVNYGAICPLGCQPGVQTAVATTQFAPDGVTHSGPASNDYFDAFGRRLLLLVQGFDGTLLYTLTEYDSNGRMARISRPFLKVTGAPYPYGSPAWTTFAYDDLGRVRTATAPNGGVTTNSHAGLTSTVTNPLGHVTTFIKNPQGLNATVTDALGHGTNYLYDAFGGLTRVTDPSGNVTANTYDIRGNKTSSTDPDMGLWTYTYDALGELLTQSDPNQRAASASPTALTYDVLGRVTGRVEPGMTSVWTFDTAVHGLGAPATATAPGYSRAMAYDSLGRPVQTTFFGANSFATTYDTITGQIGTVTYASGFTAKYVYNTYGYLAQIKDNASGTVLWTANARDAELHVIQSTAGNGVVTANAYDLNTGLMTSVRAGPSNGVAAFDYQYDLAGNLIYRSDNNSSVFERFCYDPLDRLTKAALGGSDPGTSCTGGTVKTIAYDALGNITNKSDVGTYAYASTLPHAISSITGTVNGVTNPTYVYDANGNMTGGAGRGVTYTAFNMAGAIIQGTTTAAFQYDPEHNRFSRTDTVAGVTTATTYLNDPVSGVMSELVSAGTLTWHDYLKTDGHIVAERFCTGSAPCTGGATWRYVVTDELGSTATITDQTGTVVERDAYDPWGKRRNTNGTDNTACALTSLTTRGYTGHEHIDAECLINMNARIYDPTVGRFMTPDNVIADVYDGQGLNRYTYVDNRPMTLTDPTGHYNAAIQPLSMPAGAQDFMGYVRSQGGWGGIRNDADFSGFSRSGAIGRGTASSFSPEEDTGATEAAVSAIMTPWNVLDCDGNPSGPNGANHITVPKYYTPPGSKIRMINADPRTKITIANVSGHDNAFLFWGSVHLTGTYQYFGVDGYIYTGTFTSDGSAYGLGAGAIVKGAGFSDSLGALFGNSSGTAVEEGLVGTSVSNNDSGQTLLVFGGRALGGTWDQTNTMPVGVPQAGRRW
jgi:RHS repeat-associated protein